MPRRKNAKDGRPEGMEGSQHVMSRALARLGMTDVAKYLLVRDVFHKAVGALIASNAEPISLSRGQLVIAAHSSTWQTELHFLRERMAERINAALPAPWVERVRLVARSKSKRGASSKDGGGRHDASPAAPPFAAQCEADMTAQSIGDADVRAAFARMMASGLAARGPGDKV